jgi:hypothetical protein
MLRYQNAGQDRNLKIDNKSFGNVARFKYLGTRVTNPNFIYEEIKSRLKPEKGLYQSVQSLLSSCLLSKNNLHFNIHRSTILALV